MIRLGLRLTVRGGREAIARLALIAVAVAIGIALILTTLAAINALNTQNAKYAWLETGYSGAQSASSNGSGDPMWWSLRAETFHGRLIGRVDLAATGPASPVPPGIPALPAAGQFYASPALRDLLASTPADQLSDRFPGTEIGTINSKALPAPDSLVIIIGRHVDELAASGAKLVTQISTTVPTSCSGDCAFGVGTNHDGLVLVLSVVVAALLFPVLVFIGGATRLAASRREQRFAAMRLVGATPQQVSSLATTESLVATGLGVVIGFGLFFVVRPAIAKVSFTGERFFLSDLALHASNVVTVAVGVPVAAAIAARIALRQVNVSPLGVSRHVPSPPPRARRVAPLLIGIAWLGYLAATDVATKWGSVNQAYGYLAGVFTVMIGLVVVGPWLTMLGARAIARRASRPPGLIAARRLSDNPRLAFRAISGLVLAVFVASCAIGIITTIVAYNGGSVSRDSAAAATLVVQKYPESGHVAVESAVSSATLARLSSLPGVVAVASIHGVFPAGPPPGSRTPIHHAPILPSGASSSSVAAPVDVAPIFLSPSFDVRCDELALLPILGTCAPGAHIVHIDPDFGTNVIGGATPMAAHVWPADPITDAQLDAIPVVTVVVGTDRTPTAVERARTVLELDRTTSSEVQTISEQDAQNQGRIDDYRRLADVVLTMSLPIAGCSLAVSIAGSLAERRRPFSLLRLSGAPLRVLRRVVSLEAAVPLLLGVVAAGGTGMLCAALFVNAQLGETLQPPSLQYYVLVIIGVIASLAIIASNFPLLAWISGPESARND